MKPDDGGLEWGRDPALSIFAAAEEAGAAPALVAGGEILSFASLAARVRERLASGNAEPDAALVLVGDSDGEVAIAILAAIAAGLPLFLIHPRWPPRERDRYLADLGLPPLPPGQREARVRWPAGAPPAGAGGERILAVLPTSGSSGRPKGVALSRRAFRAALAASAAILGWQENDRWLLSLPLAHVGGLSILLRCLAARRTTVLADPAARFAPALVAAQLERDRITLLSLVPTALRRLLALEDFQLPARLRAILVGGAAASPALLATAAARGWPCLLTYGATEAGSQIATQEKPGLRGCGRPVPGVEVKLDPEGLIAVRGANLLSFYLPSGQSGKDEDGFFKTGDLGRWNAEGQLEVLGRADDVIVSGGENVHPLQVEAALEEDPAIAAAAVFPLPDEEWGQAVAAALVPASGRKLPEIAALRERLRASLPPYALPRRLFEVETLPQNAVGKIDRRALAALLSLSRHAGRRRLGYHRQRLEAGADALQGIHLYSHATDGKLAPAIQSGLHRFARPWYRLRALRVFRDKTSLAVSPALWPAIARALGESEYFLLFASPRAARSPWVEREVAYWLEARSPATLLIVLTEGELLWDPAAGDFDWRRTDALPARFAGVLQDEPFFLDLRWAQKEEQLSCASRVSATPSRSWPRRCTAGRSTSWSATTCASTAAPNAWPGARSPRSRCSP